MPWGLAFLGGSGPVAPPQWWVSRAFCFSRGAARGTRKRSRRSRPRRRGSWCRRVRLSWGPPDRRGSRTAGEDVALGADRGRWAGQVWFTTSWGVTRVDPTSGESTSWDVSDDAGFASISALAPTSGAGVWLLYGDRVRLFDGQRFTVDVQVPEEIFTSGGAPGTVGHVHDLAEAGSDVWLRLHDVVLAGDAPGRSVARWSGGTWTVMARTTDGIGGYLEADVDDLVWAGGWLASEGPADGSGLSRWDETGWSLPGTGSDQVQGRRGRQSLLPLAGSGCYRRPVRRARRACSGSMGLHGRRWTLRRSRRRRSTKAGACSRG